MVAVSVQEELLERVEELERLDSLLDAAASAAGRLAVIEGPAGIGKSALLAAARGRAAKRGIQVFGACGGDLEGEFAHGVVRQLLEKTLSRDDAERDSLLGGAASYAAAVFASPEGAGQRPEAAAPAPTALLHGLFWLVANLAERGPLVLSVDDAQWADAPSLRFLDYLGRRLDEVPVAVVLAVKPVEPTEKMELVRRIEGGPEAAVIHLRPLSLEAASRLIRSVFAPDADERFTEACYAATGGNPLLLRELARALTDEGVAPSAGEADRVARLVPDAVARHVLVRLSRLPPSAAALARAAAVLGGGELGHAAALADLDEATAAEALDSLVSVDILSPERPLEFVHPLLREVIYAEIAPGERAVAHGRAAALLADVGAKPERTASQLIASEPAGAEWVVEVLRAAARDAHARGGARSAVTYLTRALAEPPSPAVRASVLRELGMAEANEAMPEAPDHLAEALRLTPDPRGRAAIAPHLAVALEYQGRAGEAVEVLEQTIEALGDGDWELRLRLKAQAVVAANTFLESRRALRERVARARALLPRLESRDAGPLLSVLAQELAYRGATAKEAVECAERGLAASRHSSWLAGAVEVIIAAEALADCGRLSAAEAVCDELIESARAEGATLVESSAVTARTHVLNRKGQVLDAEADARLALELATHEPGDFLRPYKLSQLAEALIERGEQAAAVGLLTPAELARHEPDQTTFQLILRDTYARLLWLEGRTQEALPELEEIEGAAREWDIRNPVRLRWRETAALTHHQLGDRERAVELAEGQLRDARAFGAPSALGIALRTSGLIAANGGIDQLREAVAVLEDSEARLEHGRTLVELGAALRRSGHRAAAREPLRAGLELADRCSARPLAERARQELLATGARPRRPRSTGSEALTPSERRIATMAADGLANREIAQALYLSLKTVEMHLSHTYRKLDIRSRAQLADTLGEGDGGARE